MSIFSDFFEMFYIFQFVYLKDSVFRKIALKVDELEKYHPKTAPLLASTTTMNYHNHELDVTLNESIDRSN